MRIKDSVALVTGANRGFGRALAQELRRRGARTVYGAARDPATITDIGITPVRLDVTDPRDIAAAAELARDVTLLVNNAGVNAGGTPAAPAAMRTEFDTNVFGLAAMSRAFAPVLAANGGGAILNVLSVLSFVSFPRLAGYSASKAAAWSLTNAMRVDLLGQGTQVVALHVGFMDTDMAAAVQEPKADPVDVAAAALDGIEDGLYEVLADDTSRSVKAGLSGELALNYPVLAEGAIRNV